MLQVGDDGNDSGTLLAEGTADSIITFTALNDSVGGWEGIYFDDGSDYGCSSVLEYCDIQKGNEYNIYCFNTNNITFSHCSFDSAYTYGAKIHNSNITLNTSSIENNNIGLYSQSAKPSLDDVLIQNNTTAGIESSNEPPLISNSLIQNNNVYEFNVTEADGYPVLTDTDVIGNGSIIQIDGGIITNYDRTFVNFGGDYHIVGDIEVWDANDITNLTIEPGITFKASESAGLQIGDDANDGGSLTAEGKADSLINYTLISDTISTWEGLYFADGSDYSSAASSLAYCYFNHGNNYNVYCENTNSIEFSNCVFDSAAVYGVKINNANITINNSSMENNNVGFYSQSAIPSLDDVLIQNNTTAGIESSNEPPLISNSLIQNNNVYEFNVTEADGYPVLTDTDVIGNGSIIQIDGGIITNYDRTFVNFGGDYHIIGDIKVWDANDITNLTIEPGITFKASESAGLQIGDDANDGGSLIAAGKADSLITFTLISDTISTWEGVYFADGSDYSSAASSLAYCYFNHGNNYNVYCENTNSIEFSNCVFDSAAVYGVKINNANITINNSSMENNNVGFYSQSAIPSLDDVLIQNNTTAGIESSNEPPLISNSLIQNNNVYEFNVTEADGYPVLTDTDVIGNGSIIQIDGGIITNYDRTFVNFGGDYHIIGDISVYDYIGITDLIIEEDITFKFATGTGLQIGDDSNDGGEIHANGMPNKFIKFTAMNDSIGGWDGLYFDNGSDYSSASSLLKYCIIEKASDANVYINASDQPTFKRVNLLYSANYGLHCNNASPNLQITRVTNNNSYGIYLNGSSNPSIGNSDTLSCDLYNNATYDIYNNTANNINCTQNFWNSTDTTYINTRIYDYYDDNAKGIVNYEPVTTNSLFGNDPPEKFSLISPADNGVVTVANPVLTWESTEDPEGLDISYKVYYTADSTWSTYETSAVLTDTTYTIPENLSGIDYFWWKVSARDDLVTIFSEEINKFVVSFPPVSPDPIVPLIGDYMTASDYLIWLAATNPDSNDVISQYHIQIDEDENFNTPEIDINIDCNSSKFVNKFRSKENTFSLKSVQEKQAKWKNAYAVKINSLTSYDSLDDNTYYYWRVAGIDGFDVEGEFSSGDDKFIYYADGIEIAKVQDITVSTDGVSTQLNWSEVTHDQNGAAITVSHYNIYRGEELDFEPNALNYLGSTATTSFTDNSEIENDKIFYVITAVVGLDNYNHTVTKKQKTTENVIMSK